MVPICVVGDLDDLSSVYVSWLAGQRGVEVLTLPEATLGIDWTFEFDDSRPAAGWITSDHCRHPIGDLRGAFVRFNPEPPVPEGLDLSAPQRHAFLSERRNGLHHLLDVMPCLVANRPSAGRSNASKPHQMRLLSAAGFSVPRWIASNDECAVKEFAAGCPTGVIYKACSGLRARVRRLDDELLERLGRGTTPVVVQEYVPGRDVRVHTVGERVFPTQVVGAGVDYRFEHHGSQYSPTTVPDEIAARCCRVADAEALTLAGFDFRVTNDGCWYCLEVNPVPSFLPYEMQTGQQIAQAILDAF